jgi:long-chain acyl-CoA synthetase
MKSSSDKPWIKGYKVGPFKIAETLQPYPKVPLFSFLDDTASRYPNRPACLYLGRKITWKELKTHVDKLASGLRELGIGKGDRVATILPTSPQFVISDYAILKAGAIHVPCSLLHKKHDLVHEIGESGATVIICLDSSLDLVKSIKVLTGLKTIIVTAIEDFSLNEPKIRKVPGARQLRDIISGAGPSLPEIDIDPERDLALLVFTGGATGKPKGVMLSHFNLTANTLQCLPWFMGPLQGGIKGKSSLLIAIPAFHSFGHSLIRSAVYWGLQMIMIPDPRDVDTIVAMLKRHRPFLAPLVPTQYMTLV